jgi:hypothetical protein
LKKHLRKETTVNQLYGDPSNFMPIPEFLTDDPEHYEIIDSNEVRGLPSNGMVDQVNKVMFVPLDASGRVVSRHECAHVLWTPIRGPRIRGYMGFLQAVEDGRINRGLRLIGLGIDLEEEQIEQVVRLGKIDLEHDKQGLLHWALRTIASYGTNAEQPLLALIGDGASPALPFEEPLEASLPRRVRDLVVCTHGKLERARVRERGPVARPKTVQRIARWLRCELLKLGLPEPKNGGPVGCCLGAGTRIPNSVRRRRLRREAFGGNGAGSGPGRMRISKPTLIHACAAVPRGVTRGRRLAAEGTELREIARYASDQKVFTVRAPRRRGGGSVLIDTSGSMSLGSNDIDKIIARAPEATLVAIYSGRESEGELRIVVRDGKRISVEGLSPFGPSNVVDLPALEWLAKQPKPRIWISDGNVTGVNDMPSRGIRARCKDVCRRSRIQRVDNAAAAAKLLVSGAGHRASRG